MHRHSSRTSDHRPVHALDVVSAITATSATLKQHVPACVTPSDTESDCAHMTSGAAAAGHGATASFLACSFNMCKAIVGAGTIIPYTISWPTACRVVCRSTATGKAAPVPGAVPSPHAQPAARLRSTLRPPTTEDPLGSILSPQHCPSRLPKRTTPHHPTPPCPPLKFTQA